MYLRAEWLVSPGGDWPTLHMIQYHYWARYVEAGQIWGCLKTVRDPSREYTSICGQGVLKLMDNGAAYPLSPIYIDNANTGRSHFVFLRCDASDLAVTWSTTRHLNKVGSKPRGLLFGAHSFMGARESSQNV